MFVHYDPTTYRVMQASNRAFVREGLRGAFVNPSRPAPEFGGRRVYAVDPRSLFFDEYLCRTSCDLVELPPDPIPVAHVKAARNAELASTDQFINWPSDRPGMSEPQRATWIAYRQALRDLGQLATGEEMLAAWPTRPDGRRVSDTLTIY